MAYLKDLDAGKVITTYVSLDQHQEVNRTSQTLLDGTVYTQIMGAAVTFYDVRAFVNRTGKARTMTAESRGNLLEVFTRHGTYSGRITELKFGERLAGDWFEATITLAKE